MNTPGAKALLPDDAIITLYCPLCPAFDPFLRWSISMRRPHKGCNICDGITSMVVATEQPTCSFFQDSGRLIRLAPTVKTDFPSVKL